MGDVTDSTEDNMVEDGLISNEINLELGPIRTVLTMKFKVSSLLTVKVDTLHSKGRKRPWWLTALSA